MNSSSPCTNDIQLHRQELDLNQQKLMPSLQETIIEQNTATTKIVDQQQPIQPILTYQLQRHPHRQYLYQYLDQDHYQFFGIEIVRLNLKNWTVKYAQYNEGLSRYLSVQEFTRRIKEFNATSRKLRFYQIMIFVLLSVITSTLIIGLINNNNIIFGVASLISIAITIINYWLFVRNGKLQTKYLNKLIRKFNKEDVSKNIYWKLIKTGHNRANQFYLVIELSGLKPSVYEKKNVPHMSIIYDYDQNYPSSNDIHRSNFVNFDADNVNFDNVTNETYDADVNFDNVTIVADDDNMDDVNSVTTVINNKNDVNNDNDNVNNDNDNVNNDSNDSNNDNINYRHQSINCFDRVTSTELLSTRVSVESAQIRTAIRTRPYELKPPVYYEITK